MSKRFWRGICLTPWLLASTGCATVPSGHSASSAPLPTERKLAIAQTFEKQGHTTQARAIYEQILAADPASAVAAQRLETLIAEAEAPAGSKGRRSSRQTTPQPLARSNAEQALASQSKMKTGLTQVAAQQSSSAEATPQQSSAVNRIPGLPEPVVTGAGTAAAAQNALEPVPPSPVASPSKEQISSTPRPATETEDDDDVEWELPEKRLAVDEVTPEETEDAEVSDLGQAAIEEQPALASEAAEDIPELAESTDEATAEQAPQEPVREGDGIPEGLRSLFGDFKLTMVDQVCEHREEFQGSLVAIAIDPEIELQHRGRAVFLLSQLGPDAIQAVPSLRRMLSSESDLSLRLETAEAILMIQPDSEIAVQFLLSQLHSSDSGHRWYAAFALRLSASADSKYAELSINRLLECAAEDDVRLRRMAMLSLGAFGPAASKAVPMLTKALEDSDEMTRLIAKTSLKLITQQSEFPAQAATQSTEASFHAN